MKKLRVGFIGSGGMADAHLQGLGDAEKFPDVQIAAFCDVVIERAQAQCEKYASHAPAAYASPQTMIAEAGLDACYILLPPFAHGAAERACIAGKVPFLTEKPIGLDLGLLRELRDEVKQQNLLAAAGYMNRYQPSVQRAKEAMSADRAVMAYGWWLGGPPLQSKPKTGEAVGSLIMQWWADKSKSGGQFHEQVTHTVDLVRYFLGDATEVFAHATTSFNKSLADLSANYSIDDALTTSIKFESGAIATINASVATPVGGGILLEVLGMNSAIKFSGWGHDARILRRDAEEETVKSVSDIFAVEDRQFLDAIHTGDASKVLSTYVAAFNNARITLAASESAQSGQPVDVRE